jgi:hypothetical protein
VHAGKSRGWRRAHSKAVAAWHKGQDELRAARKARAEFKGEQITPAQRKEERKRASIGSRASGTIAATGTVVQLTPAEIVSNAAAAKNSGRAARKADRKFAAEGGKVAK